MSRYCLKYLRAITSKLYFLAIKAFKKLTPDRLFLIH